jgi:hypothetical protein
LGDSEDQRAFVYVGRNLNHPRAPARGILQAALQLVDRLSSPDLSQRELLVIQHKLKFVGLWRGIIEQE